MENSKFATSQPKLAKRMRWERKDISWPNWAIGGPIKFVGVSACGRILVGGWVCVTKLLPLPFPLLVYNDTTWDSTRTSSTCGTFSIAFDSFSSSKGGKLHKAGDNPRTCIQHIILPSTCSGHCIHAQFVRPINMSVEKGWQTICMNGFFFFCNRFLVNISTHNVRASLDHESEDTNGQIPNTSQNMLQYEVTCTTNAWGSKHSQVHGKKCHGILKP